MKIRIPHPVRAHRARTAMRLQMAGFTTAQTIFTWLETMPIKHTLTVKHEPRPPAPRPSHMIIVWELQQGAEWREYVQLYGQRSTIMTPPQFMRGGNDHLLPPVAVRYEFGYTDGSPW